MRGLKSSLLLCGTGLLGITVVVTLIVNQRNRIMELRSEALASSSVLETSSTTVAKTVHFDGPQNSGQKNLSVAGKTDMKYLNRLTVGAIGIDVRLETSNIKNGLLSIPEAVDEAGQWWVSGKTGVGPLLVAGHATWNGRPGAFAKLEQIRLGQIIELSTQAGHLLYQVREVAVYPKQQIPEGIIGKQAPHRLVLVTCTGPMVRQELPNNSIVIEPRDNLVVIAEPLTVTR